MSIPFAIINEGSVPALQSFALQHFCIGAIPDHGEQAQTLPFW